MGPDVKTFWTIHISSSPVTFGILCGPLWTWLCLVQGLTFVSVRVSGLPGPPLNRQAALWMLWNGFLDTKIHKRSVLTGRSEMLHDLYVPFFDHSGCLESSKHHQTSWERMNHVPCEKAVPLRLRWLMFRLPGTVSKSFSLGVEKSQLAETFRTAPKRHVWRSHGSHGRLGRRRSTSVSPKSPSPSDDFWMLWRCLTGETNTGWSSGCKFPMTSAEWIFVFAVWFGRYPWITGWKGEGFPYQGVDSC